LHAHPNTTCKLWFPVNAGLLATLVFLKSTLEGDGIPSRLNNLAEDVKLTCYEFFGCILTSLSSEVVFFTQQCRTDDFFQAAMPGCGCR